MGTGRWDSKAWDSYASATIKGKKTVDDVFAARRLDPSLNPYKVSFRESCDSSDNPSSTPIIIGLDVTGSMGIIADSIAREGLEKLATEIYNRKPVSDPHIMFMGIGDVKYDSSPLQVTQFEADIRIAKELTKIYVEHGGGGNNSESYTLPWWFAGMHTKCDNFIKRGKKGYLFTIGDEECPKTVLKKEIEKVFGDTIQTDSMSAQDLLRLVSKQYEVFHIIIEEGSHMRYQPDEVIKSWNDILGQRVLRLSDYTKLPELIVSTLQVLTGEDKDNVSDSWDGSTSLIIRNAIKELVPNVKADDGLVKF
ncbi:hypothetical protein [Clostridium beijerinckii]|uniref:hypothetical protein n=1 Tax=Clostridium beijerinckii TaxID=1520 RepID=UPI00047D4922|nr:hypothetical protein [Clostridium beijerinckii]